MAGRQLVELENVIWEVDTDKKEATVFEDRIEEDDSKIKAVDLKEGIEAYEKTKIFFEELRNSYAKYGIKLKKNDIHVLHCTKEEFKKLVGNDADPDFFLEFLTQKNVKWEDTNIQITDWASEREQRNGEYYIHVTDVEKCGSQGSVQAEGEQVNG